LTLLLHAIQEVAGKLLHAVLARLHAAQWPNHGTQSKFLPGSLRQHRDTQKFAVVVYKTACFQIGWKHAMSADVNEVV